jgi:hypothetical protein
MIMTATLMTVAATDRRMMNRENDFCWLKAILLAIKVEMFTINRYSTYVSSNQLPFFPVMMNGKGLQKYTLVGEIAYF